MSITREQIRALAEFQDDDCGATTFYFQPATPKNRAHKEDAILIKDLLREALHRLENGKGAETKAKKESIRADLERVGRLAGELRSNGTHAKAIFACAAKNVWQEYELPPNIPATRLFVDRHFHLQPVAHLLGASPRLGVVLMDRHRARIFDLRLGELTEIEGLFQPLSRKGRSDGYAGYDAGHAQRRVDDEVRQHYKAVAAALKLFMEKGVFEKWILGCQEAHCAQLQAQLHPYLSDALLGRFTADVVHITAEEIRSRAEEIVARWQDERRRKLVDQALTQARSHGRGVTGLRRVLRSLELGEVQTLLIGDHFEAHAVECSGCGHMDAHLVQFCPVCGKATQEIVDVGEAILPRVISRDVEMFYVQDDAEFDKVGNIAALLRFRAEPMHGVDVAITDQLKKAGSVYPGRLRRFASR
jgi:peptide subunit release factor 1 (eRF1)